MQYPIDASRYDVPVNEIVNLVAGQTHVKLRRWFTGGCLGGVSSILARARHGSCSVLLLQANRAWSPLFQQLETPCLNSVMLPRKPFKINEWSQGRCCYYYYLRSRLPACTVTRQQYLVDQYSSSVIILWFRALRSKNSLPHQPPNSTRQPVEEVNRAYLRCGYAFYLQQCDIFNYDFFESIVLLPRGNNDPTLTLIIFNGTRFPKN